MIESYNKPLVSKPNEGKLAGLAAVAGLFFYFFPPQHTFESDSWPHSWPTTR
jgi:hypothetical protein